MMEKRWIASFDELHSALVFRFTDAAGVELSPRLWFKREYVSAAEKDSRRTLSLSQVDIDYPAAMAAWEEAKRK